MDKTDIYGQIMDKVQKLTGALYRVTDLLSDREPLKWLLRNKAINIYENIASIIFAKNKEDIIEETLNNLSQIISILELVSMGPFISNLNFGVLKKEYVNFKALIEGKKTDISQEQKLLSDISNGQPSIGQSDVRHDVRHRVANTSRPAVVAGVDGQLDVQHGMLRKAVLVGRKQKILEFLANQGPKNISEITPVIEGISGKSIQRDLLDLVKSGKLKTEGEKRWRKYSIS